MIGCQGCVCGIRLTAAETLSHGSRLLPYYIVHVTATPPPFAVMVFILLISSIAPESVGIAVISSAVTNRGPVAGRC